MLSTLFTRETLSKVHSTIVIYLVWKGYFCFGPVEAGIRTLSSCVVPNTAEHCTYLKQ